MRFQEQFVSTKEWLLSRCPPDLREALTDPAKWKARVAERNRRRKADEMLFKRIEDERLFLRLDIAKRKHARG